MGYLFLLISICSGGIKGFVAKKVSNKTNGIKSAVLTNFIRMLFCIPVGFIFVLIDGGIESLAVDKKVLGIAALAGASTCIFIVSWLIAVQKSAYTAVDTFVSMGLLVPILLSLAFYQERISCSQIIGLVLLFISVILMTLYSNQIKAKLGIFSLLLLLVVGLSNGITDFTQKIFKYNNATGAPASVFNFYIYVFSAVILLVVFLCLKEKKPAHAETFTDTQKTKDWDKQKVLYILIMAIFLFCNTYFKTLASERLPAVQVYPLAQGSALVLSSLMAALFFKEKIKPLCIVGLIVLFTGLLLINVIVF